MILRSTQPLVTWMSTIILPKGKGRPERKTDSLAATVCRLSRKCGSLDVSQFSGPPRWIALLLHINLLSILRRPLCSRANVIPSKGMQPIRMNSWSLRTLSVEGKFQTEIITNQRTRTQSRKFLPEEISIQHLAGVLGDILTVFHNSEIIPSQQRSFFGGKNFFIIDLHNSELDGCNEQWIHFKRLFLFDDLRYGSNRVLDLCIRGRGNLDGYTQCSNPKIESRENLNRSSWTIFLRTFSSRHHFVYKIEVVKLHF
jgi:hypothetical protein